MVIYFSKGVKRKGVHWCEVKWASLDSQWDCFDAWDVIVLHVIVCRSQKTQLQLLDVTSMNPSSIWIQGCCLRRWPCCTNWQLTSWIGCEFIYKLKLRHKLLNSMLTSYFTSHDCGCQHCSFICMSSHELIRWRNCCLIFKIPLLLFIWDFQSA